MGAKNSKGTFNRQAEARQSQKKTYQKFRQSITKLTKDVNKVKIQNKEKLLELEIAIKSAANDLEIAKTYTEPEFEVVYVDFLKNCEELDKIVKNKLHENDKNLEESGENERPRSPQNTGLVETQANIDDESLVNNGPIDIENAIFAEDVPPPDDKKKNKKSKKDSKSDDLLEGAIKKPTKKDKKNKNKEALEVNSLINEDVDQSVAVPSKKETKNKDSKQVDDQISRDIIDNIEKRKNSFKKRFWSFPMRIKRKLSTATSIPDTPEPIIIIQDPDNEERSLQNIEINQLQKAIKSINIKDKTKRRSKAQSQFFDQQSGEAAEVPPTPSSTPVLPAKQNEPLREPPIQQQDSLQQIHNIRMSISTLEEMTKIYRLAKRGNYDYIHDNLCLCVNKLKDMDQDSHLGMLTLRHEKKLAMHQAQECLDVLEGKIALPDSFDNRRSSQDNQRVSGGFPQVVIARMPSKKRESNHQKSVEFIDITNNDEIIDFSLGKNKETHENEYNAGSTVVNRNRELEELENISRDSTDFSDDDDLKDILMSLQDSTEELSQEKASTNKPVLITSF